MPPPDPEGRQPALVTNHFGLQAEDVVARLRGRWAQESLFRYLRANFGLDSLPEHRLQEMDPQARVVNPVWRNADNLIRRLRGRSGQQQERLRRGRLKAEQEQVLDFGIFRREIVGLFEPGRLSSFSHSDEPSTAKLFLARDQTMQIRPSTTPSHPQVRMGWQDFPD